MDVVGGEVDGLGLGRIWLAMMRAHTALKEWFGGLEPINRHVIRQKCSALESSMSICCYIG